MGEMPEPQRWPGGQLARYLTAGTATVDVTSGARGTVQVDCQGCGHHDEASHYDADNSDDPLAQNERIARARAEAHAERCRAIAPPAE